MRHTSPFASTARILLLAAPLLAAACGSPSRPPVGVDDAGGAGDAAPLQGCYMDADCKGALKKCDPAQRVCVGCLASADCPLGQVCDAAKKACVPGCTQGRGCGDAGLCEADAGSCVECLRDADCKSPGRSKCDPATRTCGECLPSKDDCRAGTYCGAKNGVNACVPGCKADADCLAALPDAGVPDGGAPDKTRCDVAQHQCVVCLADADCPLGSVCKAGACVPGCTQQHGCPQPLACCGGACTDTAKDGMNCGACGTACGGGQACCGGACSSTMSDPNNCGGCGMACRAPNAMSTCSNASCGLGACNMGFSDCNKDPKDGCETATGSDLQNCGGCGVACNLPNASALCVGGKCAIGGCNANFRDCNGDPADGCEVNVQSDPKNCGICGSQCAAPNAMVGCTNGRCQITGCPPGFADCNFNIGDGCETNTMANMMNCGGCNTPCALPNAQTACVNSVCQLAQCNAGYADCDGNAQNGCEAALQTDNKNCGACNKPCGQGTVCVMGACTSACANALVDDANTLCVPAGMSYSLAGDKCYATQITINGTLNVKPFDGTNNGLLTLRSPKIVIGQNGSIVGTAAGRAGAASGNTSQGGVQGGGPGGGCGGGPGSSVGQGGSGGGYGGAGGTPKQPTNWTTPCDRCTNATVAHCVGAVGAVQGTQAGADFDMGSGGGSGGNSSGCNNAGGRGGAGGAGVVLLGVTVQIDGSINVTGEAPPADMNACGYHPGGGGGAGGAIVVRAATLTGAGSLIARGGAGGSSPGQSNDWGWAGGGGGGGRIKIFATTDGFGNNLDVAAGAGGSSCPGTYCYAGMAGVAGTTNRSQTIPNMWTQIGCGGQ